jgi:protein disulfide-isomerase A1
MKFAFALVLLCSSAVAAEDDGDVIVLTAANFDETIKKYDQLMVEFYAPWCGFCQAIEPIYRDAAIKLKEKGSKARLAKLDATVEEHKPIKEDFKVTGFPQLFLVQAGLRIFVRTEQFLDAGSDQQGVENMVEYMEERAAYTNPSTDNPLWHEVNSEEEAFDNISNETKFVKIGFFFPDFDSKEATTFKNFALESANIAKYRHVVSRDKALMAKYKVEPPGIVMVHADDKSDFVVFDNKKWESGPYEMASFTFKASLPKYLIYGE